MTSHVYVCSCALLKCVPKTCLMVRSNQPSKLANSECLHNKIKLLASFTYGKKKDPEKPVRDPYIDLLRIFFTFFYIF